MKRCYLLLAIAIGSIKAGAQPFITYGNNVVTKQEFLKAYNKNKTQVADKEKSLREYVDLYSNFKLKVKAAEELRLDTLPQIQYDIRSFRDQVIENYLNDEKGISKLVNEAFYRAQKDLRIIHYAAPVPAGATPADTARAYAAIQALYTGLKNGSSNEQALVQKLAGENQAVKRSDFGFVTAFTLPYEYENIVYSLKKGELSKPYRSKNGWHLFKISDERPNTGMWSVAQILISIAPDADEEARAIARRKAEEVYSLLKKGDNFSSTAKIFSDDKISYLNGGELPEFGTGMYSADFEGEVFKLQADGEISRPFLTEFGYHIVKRIAHKPTPATQQDAAFMYDLRQKVLKDARVNAEKQQYLRGIISMLNTRRNNQVKDADLFRFADSLMNDPSLEQTKKMPISNKKVLRVKDQDLTGADWLAFVRDYKTNFSAYQGETNKQLWDKFVEVSALNYYKQHLEEYNPEFSFQMQEFKEGNMLFEIMERNVWGKAINDSAGLLKYYNAHPSNFKWAPSADVLIFNCSSVKVAEDAMKALKKGKNWRELAEEQAANAALQADSGRYEITQIIGTNYASMPTAGTFTSIVTNVDGTATFVKYLTLHEGNQQRTFEEARGLVINEYQQELEKEWLAALKKKYPVKVNEKILAEMLQ